MNKEFIETLTQNLVEMIPRFPNGNTRDAIKAVMYAFEDTAEEMGVEFKRKTIKRGSEPRP